MATVVKDINEDPVLWEITFYYLDENTPISENHKRIFPALDFDDALLIAREFCSEKMELIGLVQREDLLYFEAELDDDGK